MTTLEDLWPAAALRARAGDLELRWIDDELLVRLAELASRGVHGDDSMPFSAPWSRGQPEQVARNVVTYQWGARSTIGPELFALELGVLVDGEPVGIQSIRGEHYAVLRGVETGSWLGRAHQGKGIGTRMRALMLNVVFAGLGAREVTSTAFVDNRASCAVSERTGYERDGTQTVLRDGRPAVLQRYRLTRARWERLLDEHRTLLGPKPDLEGVDVLRKQLGLPPTERADE